MNEKIIDKINILATFKIKIQQNFKILNDLFNQIKSNIDNLFKQRFEKLYG